MPGLLRALACVLPFALIAGCGPVSPAIVSEPLQPAAGGPVSYLVGSIGPAAEDDAYTHQRIKLRKTDTQENAAAVWGNGLVGNTPSDIKGAPVGEHYSKPGVASVFVLPLKPGHYEIYDTEFYWPGDDNLSINAKRKFSVPMDLEPGKAYYLGEFRSRCLQRMLCFFSLRDQRARDEVIARRYSPNLPTLEVLSLDMKPAFPFITSANNPEPASLAEERAQAPNGN
ncbi:hypothetical protein [Pseudomonas mosselii]|uniref:hypothetical protein n=1 Tax=Pseudomonas mosselii TaxID=78327 RepID=UPI0015E89BFD|nr:hypothetical protein [Pseudomonas mosselii]